MLSSDKVLNIKEKIRDLLEDLSTNGQIGRARKGKVQYVFDPNRGAYPGSFVPIGKIKGQLEPKDIILNYTEHKEHKSDNGFEMELEQFGKPISDRLVGSLYVEGPNDSYQHAVNEMRRIAGEHVVD